MIAAPDVPPDVFADVLPLVRSGGTLIGDFQLVQAMLAGPRLIIGGRLAFGYRKACG